MPARPIDWYIVRYNREDYLEIYNWINDEFVDKANSLHHLSCQEEVFFTNKMGWGK